MTGVAVRAPQLNQLLLLDGHQLCLVPLHLVCVRAATQAVVESSPNVFVVAGINELPDNVAFAVAPFSERCRVPEARNNRTSIQKWSHFPMLCGVSYFYDGNNKSEAENERR